MKHNNQLDKKEAGLVEKIIGFLAGLFTGTFMLIMLLKIFSSFWGVFIGLVLNAAIAVFILKKTPPKSQIAIAAHGLLASAVVTIVLATILWTVAQSMFQGIAS